MANINHQEINFKDLSASEIGDTIVKSSNGKPGRNVILALTVSEERHIESFGGIAVGYTIATLIADAIERQTGARPKNLSYNYASRIFTT